MMLSFLQQLAASGLPVLDWQGQGTGDPQADLAIAESQDRVEVEGLLRSWHSLLQEEVGGPALEYDAAAAREGAVGLFRSVWYYLHPHMPVAALKPHPKNHPVSPAAAAQFSADLTLRHLPDVSQWVAGKRGREGLVQALRELTRSYPLSCPGFAKGEQSGLEPEAQAWLCLKQHRGLWQLFLDRVVQRRDPEWRQHPEVCAGLLNSLGSYVEGLAPVSPPHRIVSSSTSSYHE